MCCALFIGDNHERLIFYEFFFRSVHIAPYGANGGERVKAETISKCFKKAGILDSSMDMITRDEEDLFLAADELAL